MPKKTPRGATLSDRVYASVRDDIVLGRLLPGQKLALGEIAEREGVSFNVVREALNRLTGQRLVHSAPQQGFSVASMTNDELRDLLDVRIEVETAGLTRSVERLDIEWQVEVVAAYHRLSQTHPHDPGTPAVREEWHRAHLQFHHALFSGSGNQRLTDLAVSLSEEHSLYRGWALSMLPEERLGPAEHKAIMDAALGGDAELACALLAQHYRRTTEVLFAALDGSEAAAAERDGQAPAPQQSVDLSSP